MRHDKLYNEIEKACKDNRVMEKHYGKLYSEDLY